MTTATKVYIVQSTSGHIHLALDNAQAARFWIEIYERQSGVSSGSLTVVEREMLSGPYNRAGELIK